MTSVKVGCTLLVLFVASALAGVDLQTSTGDNPSANPDSVVTIGKARFTVLTERLVRLEYSDSGKFVDAPSFTFVNRFLPSPKFTHTMDGKWLLLKTDSVTVKYDTSSTISFNKDNLLVEVKFGSTVTKWMPGDSNDGNLLGTARTLDGVHGGLNLDCSTQSRSDLHCTYGLISTKGVVVVDDTAAPQFTSDEWPWVNSKSYDSPTSDVCSIDTDLKRDCGFIGISEDQCKKKGCCYKAVNNLREGVNGVPFCYYSSVAAQDLYVFGHGHDYKGALGDFVQVAGRIPMPPRYSLGVFYSRYWAYSDVELQDLVGEYVQHDVPLDILVVDMDWHKTFYKESSQGVKDQAGQPKGWSGFTWDDHLFPNPKAFLEWMHERGLRVTVNLHPASGIQPWEERYDEMAKANGIDPATQKYVPFKVTNETFVKSWFSIVMDKLQEEGIDFYWLDWQQGENWIEDNDGVPRVNPTFWLNYLFFTNPVWKTRKESRPHLLHRWGGLGNHRYQLGFSGDVVPDWSSLDFQPYFTATASNVGYSYWSHDLGGHTEPSPAELYTRWVQWGAFSPVFRTHCTKNALNDRRIWMYPNANFRIMRDFMKLRAALNPYIYTHARITHETGVGLMRPLYYEYPERKEAYSMKNEYYFGEDIVVHPITAAVDETTEVAIKDVFIPEGEWAHWWSGERVTGPTTVTRSYSLAEMPVFVRAGSVIAMRANATYLGEAHTPADALTLRVVVPSDVKDTCKNGCLNRHYDDDGVTDSYKDDASYAWTTMSFSGDDEKVKLEISAASAKGDFVPSSRTYGVELVGVLPPKAVQVAGRDVPQGVDGEEHWSYDGSTLTLTISCGKGYSSDASLVISVALTAPSKAAKATMFSGYAGLLSRAVSAKAKLDAQWGIHTIYQDDYPNLLFLGETGSRITFDNTKTDAEISAFQDKLKAANDEVDKMSCDDKVKAWLLANLSLEPSQKY